jgi:hypothetical protein
MTPNIVIVSFPRGGTRIAKVIDLLRDAGFTVKDGAAAARVRWYDLVASGGDVTSLEKSLGVSGFEFDLQTKVA